MIGRISMEPYAGKKKVPRRKVRAPIPRTDFIARRDAKSYAIDDEHVITVRTKKVSDDYLAFLRSTGVSYLFGGDTKMNLKSVLEKLTKHFGIETLLLEGGGKINGAFLAADLIDELSLLVAPVADGSIGAPSLFDASERPRDARRLKLVSFAKQSADLLRLRYRLER